MIRLHFNNSTNTTIVLCKVTRMKVLTPSEAARRNFFEIQNSSSELKVVGRSGIIDISISKEMSLSFSPNADRTSTHCFIITEEKALRLQLHLEVFLVKGYEPQVLYHKPCCFDIISTS